MSDIGLSCVMVILFFAGLLLTAVITERWAENDLRAFDRFIKILISTAIFMLVWFLLICGIATLWGPRVPGVH